MSGNSSLRNDAIAIWEAGVEAVDSARLVARHIKCTGTSVTIGDQKWSSEGGGRICVVGAGKAGAGMAEAVEDSLSEELVSITSGWVNVPDDCVRSLRKITLHGGRPAGINEPTQAGINGTQKILEQVRSLRQNDLCIVLISGGGSALLPAPVEGISLDQKLQVTRSLMKGGATIEELNCVRRELSLIKGGGLLRACNAGTFITLVISDVIGSPLETIASGPTVECERDPKAALRVLDKIAARTGIHFSKEVREALEAAVQGTRNQKSINQNKTCLATNLIIGDNSTAVQAACQSAVRLGYEIHFSTHDQGGIANEIGRELATDCLQLRQSLSNATKRCIITGGEPTVQLASTDQSQKGGRNQELVLAATSRLWDEDADGIVILSGGTDGEDGPTDAAGAFVDQALIGQAKHKSLHPEEFLGINNSYPFFKAINGLLKTGPTHTNVMDLRVALIEKP